MQTFQGKVRFRHSNYRTLQIRSWQHTAWRRRLPSVQGNLRKLSNDRSQRKHSL